MAKALTSMLLIGTIVVVAVWGVNPWEMFRQKQDETRGRWADGIVSILATSQDGFTPIESDTCSDIVKSEPINLEAIVAKMPPDFTKYLAKQVPKYYLGVKADQLKLCYPVAALVSAKKAEDDGCQAGSQWYRCLPR